MKRVTVFLLGIILIALTTMSIFLAGTIFDTGKKVDVETYFFQPGNTDLQRPGKPISPDAIGANEMRDLLIKNYITEYFYVLPDVQDAKERLDGKYSLPRTSNVAVFEKWRENTGAEILKLAENNVLRTVNVLAISQEMADSTYWRIDYELKTWKKPNDFSVPPEITTHVIYLNIAYKPGLRDEFDKIVIVDKNGKKKYLEKMSVNDYLEGMNAPISVFKFRVDDVVFPE